MKAYIETSVLLRRLLAQPGALREHGSPTECATSEITRVEALRTLDRLRLEARLTDAEVSDLRLHFHQMLDVIDAIALTPQVLETAAQSFPTVVGTLDAIHLATALSLRRAQSCPVAFITHDSQLGVAARALGFDVRGVKLE